MRKLLLFIIVCSFMSSFYSCKKNHITVNNGITVNLNHNETHWIDATSDYEISYCSDNRYCAEVSNDGVITANYVGSAEITLSNGKDEASIRVNVLPLSNYYQEPDIYFGESRESVDAKYASEDYNPTTDDVVLYPYKSDVTDYMYVYYEDDKVVAYEILVIADDISLVEEFISERYRYLGEIYGLPVYINTLALSDATMSVSYRHYDSERVIVRYYTYDWVRK